MTIKPDIVVGKDFAASKNFHVKPEKYSGLDIEIVDLENEDSMTINRQLFDELVDVLIAFQNRDNND